MKVKKGAKIQLMIIYKLSSYKYRKLNNIQILEIMNLIDEDKLNEVDKLYKIDRSLLETEIIKDIVLFCSGEPNLVDLKL
ncbi:MAG: hypothetical protein DMENIID0002_09350 [Rickettsia endosymbiont of Sergentomyia squamirostris]|uniref:Uncharacterized protein n=1 Tax=Candidatus Tisiphia endosymbiont of Sergentomyia squamirostris TaxID=3113639 RepID=A0AAT9G937_9RICK